MDTVSDMLTRIRNANLVRHKLVLVSNTKITRGIANILKNEGYIKNFEKIIYIKKTSLLLYLKYKGSFYKPVITMIKMVSRPGLRVYVGQKNIPNILGNLGIAILSTSKGIMSNHQAKNLRIGGEVLCYIW